MVRDETTPHPENPYAAPQSGVPIDSVHSEDPAIAQLRAFVGPRADVYLAKWHHLLMGGSGSAGFNWPAFLWSGLWIPYRKMYRVAAILYGTMIATTIGEDVLFVLIGRGQIPPFLDSAIGLIAALVCGFGANRWYLAHARRVIAEVHSLGLQDSECLAEISRRGGTSIVAGFGLFVCFIAAVIGVVMFFELLHTYLEATP